MENLRDDARFGHPQDLSPSEITVELGAVQLDGVGRQLPDSTQRLGVPELPGAPEGSDGPVFVDESGRRSKKLRRIGWVLAFTCAVYGAVLVATLVGGNSSAPWLLIPGQTDGKKAETVKVSPAPTEPVEPSATEGPGKVPGEPRATTDPNGAAVTAPPARSDSGDAPAPPGPLGPAETSPKAKPSGDTVVPPPDPVSPSGRPAPGDPGPGAGPGPDKPPAPADPDPGPDPTESAPTPPVTEPDPPAGENA